MRPTSAERSHSSGSKPGVTSSTVRPVPRPLQLSNRVQLVSPLDSSFDRWRPSCLPETDVLNRAPGSIHLLQLLSRFFYHLFGPIESALPRLRRYAVTGG